MIAVGLSMLVGCILLVTHGNKPQRLSKKVEQYKQNISCCFDF